MASLITGFPKGECQRWLWSEKRPPAAELTLPKGAEYDYGGWDQVSMYYFRWII